MKAVRAPTAATASPHRIGDELRTVVGMDVGRNAAHEEWVGQHIDDVGRGELAPHPDRQALTGELVQDVEHAKGASIMGPVMHEVIRPHVVRPLRAQPDTRAVAQPQTAPLWLFPFGRDREVGR